MPFQNIHEAIAVLDDTSRSVLEREQAIYYLERHPEPQAIQRIVQALEDPDFGVRWTAAVALARLGRRALRHILQALVEKPDSVWLRWGAHHALYYSADRWVRETTQRLQEAMRGLAADLSTEVVAAQLLQELRDELEG